MLPGRRTSASRRASRRACSPAEPAARRRGEELMALPLEPPLKPQLALSRKELPEGEDYRYEIKLDGFRCLAFVDGEEVYLQSRNGKPLGRYFPELSCPRATMCSTVRSSSAARTAMRTSTRSGSGSTRPSRGSSGCRVETPAVYVAFDLLARDDRSRCSSSLRRAPSRARGARSASREFEGAPVELMPTVATRRGGGGLARAGRGRDRQGAPRALPPGRAQGDGEGQARQDDRRRGRRLAARQGGGHRRSSDPGSLRRRGARVSSGTARACSAAEKQRLVGLPGAL